MAAVALPRLLQFLVYSTDFRSDAMYNIVRTLYPQQTSRENNF